MTMPSKKIRRHILYLSGFDPRGAGYYYRLYRDESAKQAALGGTIYEVGAREKPLPYIARWHVTSPVADVTYDFLCWDDIIRNEWPRGFRGIAAAFGRYLCDYYPDGYIMKFFRLGLHTRIAGGYPIVLCFVALLTAALAVSALYRILSPQAAGGYALWCLSSLAAAAFVLRGFYQWGEKSAAFWMLRIFNFSYRWGQGRVERIDARMSAAAQHLRRLLADDTIDEVMLVGHSVGGMLAIPVAAESLDGADARMLSKFRLLTVGACIPMICMHKDAESYRDKMRQLGRHAQLKWLDYSAKTDGASFFMQNPFVLAGLLPPPEGLPVLKSPRFFSLYEPARYKKLRYDFYNMHFLYLMATDKIGGYDYFDITAGRGIDPYIDAKDETPA